MNPTNFEGVNKIYHKPENMTDEQCMSLPVFEGVDQAGFPIIVSAWKPNKEDIEAINQGKPIFLCVTSQVMIPVSLFTVNDNGESNND